MDAVELRRFGSADRDWVVTQHADHYAAVEGFDASFGVLVAQIVDDFLTDHDPSCEAGWIAMSGTERLGCIFCVRLSDTTAKLRLFLLVPQARGLGLGKRLLQTCMGFARDQGYRDMQLWTHEEHKAAGALYAKFGWEMVASEKVYSFGQNMTEQTWRITL